MKKCKVIINIMLVCLAICLNIINIFAQEEQVKKPLDVNDIVNLLKDKISENEIINMVSKHTADVELNVKNTSILVRAGASDNLLKVIETNKKKDYEIIINNPINGQEVGATCPVRGKAKEVKGKYLWLFVHREDFYDQWWPQDGRVEVKEDGSWVRGVTFGQPRDVGFNFEIVAIWVGREADQRLQDYIKNGITTGNYPPIPLPEKNPKYLVTVKKVE